jgi:hypothetical protein
MIEVAQINERYHVGREKPGGKVYVMGATDEQKIASYSALTETLEWYQTISAEDVSFIEAYLKQKY